MTTSTCIMLVGLPGSGKSTWLNKALFSSLSGYHVLSFDDCVKTSAETFNTTYNKAFSNSIVMKNAQTRYNSKFNFFMEKDLDFVIDMTNLSIKSRTRKLSNLPKSYDKKAVVFATRRNISFSRQKHNVSRQVFDKMSRSFVYPTEEEGFSDIQIINQSVKKQCYLFDIDGTLANVDHRLHFVRDGNKDWGSFFDAMMDDVLNEDIATLYKQLAKPSYSINNTMFIVSGRPDTHYQMTQTWLDNNEIYHDGLYMRGSMDYRPDTIVKKEILDEIKRDGYDIILAVDDRPAVTRMIREEGITCLSVQDKEF